MSESERGKAVDKHRECVAEGHCRPPHKSRKDRAKWCRGKVGVPHQWQWVNEASLPNAHQRKPLRGERLGYEGEVRVCSECGKRAFDFRRRCHCGVLMVPNDSRSWYSSRHCPSCGYMKDWRESFGRRVEKKWVEVRGAHKPPCACEVRAARGHK
jgi:hypothetical protein